MSLVDKIKGAVFEDSAPKPVAKPGPPFAAAPPTAMQPTPQHFVTGIVGGGQPVTDYSDQYQKMLANTDFDQTEVGMALKRFSAPLDGVITDERQKFLAVIALARSHDSSAMDVTSKALSTFDDLLGRLANMQTEFNAATAAFERNEIQEAKMRVERITVEVAQKQEELLRAQKDSSAAQAKLQSTVVEFNAAFRKRTDELRLQRAHFESLMKG